jgi:hypothetical protein
MFGCTARFFFKILEFLKYVIFGVSVFTPMSQSDFPTPIALYVYIEGFDKLERS